jgi:polysaccharide biosynthesis/export protein
MQRVMTVTVRIACLAAAFVLVASTARAQSGAPRPNGQPPAKPNGPTAPANAPTPPPGYIIGPDDVLTVGVWKDKDLSSEVVVRPDGKVSLPLVNEIDAAGLTVDEFRKVLTTAFEKYQTDPTVLVTVKEIKSRKVFITGNVGKAGAYMLSGPTTVVQLIAMAGGVSEYADTENISVLRIENGTTLSFRVNYKDIAKRKNLKQNIELKPGDTVIVR